MMKAAQGMMANMSPEEMQRMTQMAANMDPKVMENMMKNMGGPAAGMDAAQMSEQMKQMGNMSPEQLKAGMSQAQQQMGAQKQYYYNAAMMLKNEGNGHIKSEKYTEALKVYEKALENIKSYDGDDISQLRLSLLLNSAMCHLKQKDYKKTVSTCDEALQINSKSVKALFRRGLARIESGLLAEGVGDVRLAAKLSPDDKTIADELAKVEKDCKSKGLSSEDIKAAEKKAEAAAEAGKGQSGGSSSSSAPATGGMNDPRMAQAFEQMSKNPDMLNQATEAMKNMSPEDMERMLSSSLPPGTDPEEARRKMEAFQKNPDMVKSAMETLQAMPEEERKQMMEMAAAGGGAGMSGGVPDMSKMGDMLKNPDALKTAMAAAGQAGGTPEADMMKKMCENPEMMESVTNMMKNMPPEQMQKMMEMSMKMKGDGSGAPQDPSAMMNDPEMMKAAEEMMKNISPDMLQSMAKSAGVEVSEGQAKMISKFMPYVLGCMKCWGYVKRPFSAMFSPKGRIVLAVVILLVAVLQHYYWSS
eukprot:TRINITY_DN92664_c0_g1_i1.p1 TRINITY_DN92664_c0_g1~~TRINITY_DN92664_c0_g1_i1.p1  ORF type:complete len:579 (+),score=192.71 TRINITY_DN92664_c0_g1_i1:152-1738(+)